MKQTILQELKYYQDYLLFLVVVLLGVFMKIHIALQDGKKPSWKWFVAEALVSFFVAWSVYMVFDQFLHFNKMFTYMVCAWGGSMSTIIHKKVEDVISSFFDGLIDFLKTKLTAK